MNGVNSVFIPDGFGVFNYNPLRDCRLAIAVTGAMENREQMEKRSKDKRPDEARRGVLHVTRDTRAAPYWEVTAEIQIAEDRSASAKPLYYLGAISLCTR
jgi:hypothetical protein